MGCPGAVWGALGLSWRLWMGLRGGDVGWRPSHSRFVLRGGDGALPRGERHPWGWTVPPVLLFPPVQWRGKGRPSLGERGPLHPAVPAAALVSLPEGRQPPLWCPSPALFPERSALPGPCPRCSSSAQPVVSGGPGPPGIPPAPAGAAPRAGAAPALGAVPGPPLAFPVPVGGSVFHVPPRRALR